MTKAGTRVKYFQHCQLNQLESTFKIKMCYKTIKIFTQIIKQEIMM